jgi:enamine deaminase RidA (YjgF/YER057c/UK114 family)
VSGRELQDFGIGKGDRYEHRIFQPGHAAAAGRLFAYRQGQQGHADLPGNFEAQAEQVFRNLRIAVEAAGATMADIVKLNIYLVAEVDQAAVPKLRAIRDRYVNAEKPPASTLVVVSRLARPGWLIEIEAVAAIDA